MTSTSSSPPSGTMPQEGEPSSGTSLVKVIEPRRGWQAVNVRELWNYRELLYFLIWRDVKVRYKQTILGATWAIIQPLMTMVVFSIFLGRFGGLAEGSAVPYEILVFSALVPWTFFANAASGGGTSLVSSAHLISKVYFPRLLIPLAALGAPLLDMLIAFGVLILMLAGYLAAGTDGVRISWQLMLLPIFVLMTVVTAFGVGALMSSLTIVYRDFRYVMAFLIQIWMFVSPVAYPLGGKNGVPERWWQLYAVNPMTGSIAGFRRCITGEAIPWDVVGISAVSSLLIMTAGVYYFRRIERTFADLI